LRNTRDERSVAMLKPRLQPLQHLLSVSSSIASIVVGADAGVPDLQHHLPSPACTHLLSCGPVVPQSTRRVAGKIAIHRIFDASGCGT